MTVLWHPTYNKTGLKLTYPTMKDYSVLAVAHDAILEKGVYIRPFFLFMEFSVPLLLNLLNNMEQEI